MIYLFLLPERSSAAHFSESGRAEIPFLQTDPRTVPIRRVTRGWWHRGTEYFHGDESPMGLY